MRCQSTFIQQSATVFMSRFLSKKRMSQLFCTGEWMVRPTGKGTEQRQARATESQPSFAAASFNAFRPVDNDRRDSSEQMPNRKTRGHTIR
jgi:hypothetical protein